MREAVKLQHAEELLEVERLAHVDHVDRAVDMIILELAAGQGQVLRRVERGPVGTQDHEHAERVVLDHRAVFVLLV